MTEQVLSGFKADASRIVAVHRSHGNLESVALQTEDETRIQVERKQEGKMPITTLNKVIALFLVGGVVILLVLFLHWNQIPFLTKAASDARSTPHSGKDSAPAKEANAGAGKPSSASADKEAPEPPRVEESGFWVLLAVLILPLSALLGGVVEGLSHVTLVILLRKARECDLIAKIFGHARTKEGLDTWLKRLQNTLAQDRNYEWFNAVATKDRPRTMRSTAAGVFLQTATENNFEWLVQHYATHVLASDLAFIMGLTVIYVPLTRFAEPSGLWWPALSWAGDRQVIIFIVMGLISFLALCSLSVNRDLYSHEHTARHMTLWLGDVRISSLPGEKAVEGPGTGLPGQRRRNGGALRIAAVAEVKARFRDYLKESRQGPVIVTRNGRPVAALLSVRDEEELEHLVLTHSALGNGRESAT